MSSVDRDRTPHVGAHYFHLETIYQATLNAFAAGAHGIVVSREYEEMKIEHLRAVGRAFRQVIRTGAPLPARMRVAIACIPSGF